jgi:hypothetical protein
MNNNAIQAAILGFAAGAIAFLIFHQGGFWVLTQAGLLKASVYSMAPTKPLGVPVVLSYVFWTGLWGIAGTFLVPRLPAPLRGVLGWILFAAIVPTLVNWFIVLPLKGAPVGGGFRMPGVVLAPLVYGFWGFGIWLTLQVLQQIAGKRAKA